MKQTNLAVRQSAELATMDLEEMLASLAGAGAENIQSDDIILPKLMLLQPTSPLSSEDGYRAGDLVDSINGTNYGKSAAFFVVHYYPSRTKWEGSEHGLDSITSPVECVSSDGVNGSKFGSCASCPFAQWKNVPGGKSIRPACTEFKNLLLVPAVDVASIPMLFSAKRTGLKAVRELLSSFLYTRGPIFMFETVITSVKQTNDSGTWFVPKFTKGNRVPDVATLTSLIETNKQMKAAQDRIVTRESDDTIEGEASVTPVVDEDVAF